jgi:Tfp pilus assembly protein PilP
MTFTARSLRIVSAVAMLAAAAPALAQAPKTPPKAGDKPAAEATAPPATTPPAKKIDLPVPPPNFEYTPQGRRDPFLSLVNRGNDAASKGAPLKRAEGVPGMLAGELTVRGIVLTRGAYVAMVSGPDNKVYTVRAGAKLADGVIRTITANSIVILQEVNDPLSLEKQREVRKFLRGGDEVK